MLPQQSGEIEAAVVDVLEGAAPDRGQQKGRDHQLGGLPGIDLAELAACDAGLDQRGQALADRLDHGLQPRMRASSGKAARFGDDQFRQRPSGADHPASAVMNWIKLATKPRTGGLGLGDGLELRHEPARASAPSAMASNKASLLSK